MEQRDLLRDAARQCRDFARYHDGDAAQHLRALADELDTKAAVLEATVTDLIASTLQPAPPAHRGATPRH
jgi:hypothetical protein